MTSFREAIAATAFQPRTLVLQSQRLDVADAILAMPQLDALRWLAGRVAVRASGGTNEYWMELWRQLPSDVRAWALEGAPNTVLGPARDEVLRP